MTAGTLSARRMRRAAPLPNSLRASALIRSSDIALVAPRTCCTDFQVGWLPGCGTGRRHDMHRTPTGAVHGIHEPTASITEHPCLPGLPRRGNFVILAVAPVAREIRPVAVRCFNDRR